FDGGSFIVDPSGTALATAEQFVSKVLVADLELTAGTGHRSGTFAGVNVQRKVLMDEPLPAYEKITKPQVQPLSDEGEVWSALVTELELTAGTGHRGGACAGVNVQRKVLSDEPLPAYEKITNPQVQPLSGEAEVWSALVLELRDYERKDGFSSVILGFSGGID